jgi:hypothetical protein
MPRRSKQPVAASAPVIEPPPPAKTPKAKAPPKHSAEELKKIRLENLIKARAALAQKRADAKKSAPAPKVETMAEPQPQ